MRAAAVALLPALVVAAACAGDGPPEGVTQSKPRCRANPGVGAQGFVLTGTEEVPQGDTIGIRREYRDQEGRLLVYLLGIHGEVGEGLPLIDHVELVSGRRGRFLGESENWVIVWEDEPPCPQIAVVGNGFTERDFLAVMQEAQIVVHPH